MAQQHAIWKAMALEHLQEMQPELVARLQQEKKLDEYLTTTANLVSDEMRRLMLQGATWDEAWEQTRETLFPATDQHQEVMPETEGFKAHRELIQGLSDLRMPGEREE